MTILLWSVGLSYLLWVLFLAVMALHHAWDRLPGIVRALAVPAVLVVVSMDVALNLVVTIPFADLPREATLSQRMSRYKHGSGWRYRVAHWVCANLLDPFELGGHCRA